MIRRMRCRMKGCGNHKKTAMRDFRVVAWPDFIFERDEAGLCHQLLREIKRHVDNIKNADIEYVIKDICSFCEDSWEI